MENEFKLNPQELQMQGLLSRYLDSRKGISSSAGHIEDDLLSAFVEGTLNSRESDPIVTHLVDCGFCRNTTAELVRLELAFADEPGAAHIEAKAEPAKISEVLSGIFSKIFGTSDGAVFAHEETDEPQANNEEAVENTEEKK